MPAGEQTSVPPCPPNAAAKRRGAERIHARSSAPARSPAASGLPSFQRAHRRRRFLHHPPLARNLEAHQYRSPDCGRCFTWHTEMRGAESLHRGVPFPSGGGRTHPRGVCPRAAPAAKGTGRKPKASGPSPGSAQRQGDDGPPPKSRGDATGSESRRGGRGSPLLPLLAPTLTQSQAPTSPEHRCGTRTRLSREAGC